ncbi:AAA family ATPase [Polynucleobacter sphagniphilus]|jgi:pilus assembly protein CpaE|uniref:Pilus assembly protein CpaE n=1 Tax=Polynucleobacter sphagniphilus TaxID=1743169 RepID=A0AA43S571_9BURK|nr:AAA family ATPase [Polynucleobacter sphagniphilus]MDH6504279.1 pilus assembly protein CpaE [Polynucleobacter sphagniphilus]MDH6512163.1 pilus assembly protein CpaE [Polynucleobacter sphagniphilus]
MKIGAIASAPEVLGLIKEALEKNLHEDQFVFLERRNDELDIDRIDLFSTNVLIVDAETISKADLKVISSCTKEHSNPAIIYATKNAQDGQLIELMRAGVMEVISYPITSGELLEAIERLRLRRYIASTYRPRGKILSFISAKGGAGATFIAGNLGYSLAVDCKEKVLFVDLHMQFGDAAFYLVETAGPRTLTDVISQTGLDSTVIASATTQVTDNYFLLQAPDSPDKAVGIKPQHIDNLLTVAIQDYDYVIVDLPREIEAITMKVLDRSDKIYIVFQPVISYLRAVTKVLNLFNLLGYESRKTETILNRMDRGVAISLEKMEDAIQKSIDWVFPNDFVNATESVNTGIPLEKMRPHIPLSNAFKAMAGEITEVEIEVKDHASWMQKWFK